MSRVLKSSSTKPLVWREMTAVGEGLYSTSYTLSILRSAVNKKKALKVFLGEQFGLFPKLGVASKRGMFFE